MSAQLSRPFDEEAADTSVGGLFICAPAQEVPTLGALPVGARLVLRCRKDWREATVVSVALDLVTLSVGSPKGRTYRVRRPADSALTLEGSIPVLGEGVWRAARARYDARW
ncbi:MAG TPA: hypothetical protein VGV59_13705 [Pyrinomonadaceae bacterium]|nr:hypothetical protein [Pyrinomonadaceae bacterium]